MTKSDIIPILAILLVLGIGIYMGVNHQAGRALTDSDFNEDREPGTEIDDVEAPVVDETPDPTTPKPDEPKTNLPEIGDEVITSFEECVEAGNPVMESYPRQCRAGGELFIEEIPMPLPGPDVPPTKSTLCTPEQKRAQACTMEYAPVCGLVEVVCITEPCNPVPQTFGNACTACASGNVTSYTKGECEA